MVTPEVDLGARMLVYGGLFVAIPVTFVLLIRLIDYLALDDYVEQYQAATPKASQGFETAPAAVDDDGICPRCGERNEPEFTFCRACQAQIGV